MCKNPGLGPTDYTPKRKKTIHELKLHEMTTVYAGKGSIHHETGVDEFDKYLKVMRVEGGWIYGVGTDSPVFVPQVDEKNDTEKAYTKKNSVGNHERVFEYDGLYKCLDCKVQWGAGLNVPADAPLICEAQPDKTVEAPELEWVSEGRQPPPTTEYTGRKGREARNSSNLQVPKPPEPPKSRTIKENGSLTEGVTRAMKRFFWRE